MRGGWGGGGKHARAPSSPGWPFSTQRSPPNALCACHGVLYGMPDVLKLLDLTSLLACWPRARPRRPALPCTPVGRLLPAPLFTGRAVQAHGRVPPAAPAGFGMRRRADGWVCVQGPRGRQGKGRGARRVRVRTRSAAPRIGAPARAPRAASRLWVCTRALLFSASRLPCAPCHPALLRPPSLQRWLTWCCCTPPRCTGPRAVRRACCGCSHATAVAIAPCRCLPVAACLAVVRATCQGGRSASKGPCT